MKITQQIIGKLLEDDSDELDDLYPADVMPLPIQIEEVRIRHIMDNCSGSIGDLGKFTNDPDESNIVRFGEHRGEFVGDLSEDARDEITSPSREYLFWAPAQHVPHSPRNWSHLSEVDKADVIAQYGSLENADKHYARDGWKRAESYGDDWCYIGVDAEATITVDGERKIIRAGGLWGIESDSEDYIAETDVEMIDELRTQLLTAGCTKRQIEKAFENVIHLDGLESL